MRLTKHHGLGNDFLVLLDPGGHHRMRPDGARALCDRRRGVGADGFVHATDGGGEADLAMVLFNADGSRAEMSGNGIRCLAQAEARRRRSGHATLTVATGAGRRHVVVAPGPDEVTVEVTVEMGDARLVPPPPVHLAPEVLKATGVDVGNPHLVLLVDDPASVDVGAAGPALEGSVPGGVNVEWVAPAPDGGLRLVVWERGAGMTQACGTGACAAAAAARDWGLTGERVTVRMPGGAVGVVLAGAAVTLTGPATYVATVEVRDPWR